MPYKWSSNWGDDAEGIVIYHIDEAVPDQSQRGYPGHPNWPAEHYRVAVLQKDGNNDIEKIVNIGDSNDFFKLGDELGPGPAWPNTDSYQSGKFVKTGLTIKVKTEPGYIMQFEVTGL